MRLVGTLDAIFRLAVANRKNVDHFIRPATHVLTHCRPEDYRVPDFEFVWHRLGFPAAR
jgi:hypothetical protein